MNTYYKPIRFRIQDKNDCAPATFANYLEQLHHLIGNTGVKFTEGYFRWFEEEMRRSQGKSHDEATNLPAALQWLARSGFIAPNGFKMVWRDYLSEYLQYSPVAMVRQNYKGQRLRRGVWSVPKSAEMKRNKDGKPTTHFVLCLGEDEKGFIIQDPVYAYTYYLPKDLIKKTIRQIWHLTLPNDAKTFPKR